MVLRNNEMTQMQKDLYSAKDSNISVREMKHNSYKNQIFDSSKSTRSSNTMAMIARKNSASEG